MTYAMIEHTMYCNVLVSYSSWSSGKKARPLVRDLKGMPNKAESGSGDAIDDMQLSS